VFVLASTVEVLACVDGGLFGKMVEGEKMNGVAVSMLEFVPQEGIVSGVMFNVDDVPIVVYPDVGSLSDVVIVMAEIGVYTALFGRGSILLFKI
jgi:hypothetical protein